jgi:hypothetical protein
MKNTFLCMTFFTFWAIANENFLFFTLAIFNVYVIINSCTKT